MFERFRINLAICRLAREATINGSQGSSVTAPALEDALSKACEAIKRSGGQTFLWASSKQVLAEFMVAYRWRAADALQEYGYFCSAFDNENYSRAVWMATSLLYDQGWNSVTRAECLLTAMSRRDWDEVRSFGSEAAEFILCEFNGWRWRSTTYEYWNEEDWSRAVNLAFEIAKPIASDRRQALYKTLLEKFQRDGFEMLQYLQTLPARHQEEQEKSLYTWCSCTFEEVLYFLTYLFPSPTDQVLFEPRNEHIAATISNSKLPDMRLVADERLAELGIGKVWVCLEYRDVPDGSYVFSTGSKGFLYVRRVDSSHYAVICVKEVWPGNYEGTIYERFPADPRFPEMDVTNVTNHAKREQLWKDYNCVA